MKATEDAIRSADEGVERAALSAGGKWIVDATNFLEEYLKKNPSMFCDDLWSAGLEKPCQMRALGQVIRTAAKNGWIEEIIHDNGIVAKHSNSSNRQLKRVWKSKLYTGDEVVPKFPNSKPDPKEVSGTPKGSINLLVALGFLNAFLAIPSPRISMIVGIIILLIIHSKYKQ